MNEDRRARDQVFEDDFSRSSWETIERLTDEYAKSAADGDDVQGVEKSIQEDELDRARGATK